MSWAIPPALANLVALDAPTRAAVIDAMLRTTHPKVKARALASPALCSTAVPAILTSVPFLDSLNRIPDTRTWNGAAAFSSTENALLDLFDGLQAGVNAQKVFELLAPAWKLDADKTLRIIFHARSIHEGKGLRIAFFNCLAWLWDNHPRTLLANLRQIVEPTCVRARSKKRDAAKAERNNGVVPLGDDFEPEKEPEYPPRPHGSFDDLNDMLVLAINGQFSTAYTGKLTAIDEALAPSSSKQAFKEDRRKVAGGGKRERFGFANAASEVRKEIKIAKRVTERQAGPDTKVDKVQQTATDLSKMSLEERKAANKRKLELDENAPLNHKLARCGTKQARAAVIAQHAEKGLADPKLQILISEVVNLYTEFISADLERLAQHRSYVARPEVDRKADGYGAPDSSPHLFGMSYAAKWAPTPGKSADRQLHLATAIAGKLFPGDVKARRRFQSEVLAPLRAALSVPEVNMIQGPWKINYAKVPARSMARNQTNFVVHDPKGFERYLLGVASGKSTIAGASMIPHELLMKALSKDVIPSRVANLQWNSLVDSIRSSSKNELANCIAVTDVSGSMGSIHWDQNYKPIWPCIALTLLMTELARPPWNGAFITFSATPKLERVDNSLPVSVRAKKLFNAEWGYNTDYRAVFETILSVAEQSKLAPEDMVKKVFVFSDMQFDRSGKFGETEHQAARQSFAQAGYPMPELVYWNLQTAAAKPVQADTPGTALVSGFSGALMKYFIRALGEGDEAMDEDETEENVKEENVKEENVKEENVKEENVKEEKEDEWEEVRAEEKEEKAEKEKKEKNPMDHLNAIIGANPFRGIVVVD